MNIEELRSEIDMLDSKIMNLLEMRLEVVKAVGKYKQENQLEVLDQRREELIFDKIKQLNLINEQEIIDIYQNIMKITKDMQWKNMD